MTQLRLPLLGIIVAESASGLAVQALDPGSAAGRSGQVGPGDVLVSINDIGLDDKGADEITRLSASVDHRGKTKIGVLRQDGTESSVVLDVHGGSEGPHGGGGAPHTATDKVGIGLTLTAEDGRTVVADLAAWGSARWSGKVGVGDEVVTVHGGEVAGMSPAAIIALLEEVPPQTDGGVVKLGVRRKGMAPNVAPTVALLARSLPSGNQTIPPGDRSAPIQGQPGSRAATQLAVPDAPSTSASTGSDAWNPVSWLGRAGTLLDQSVSPQVRERGGSQKAEPPTHDSTARDLNQAALLTAVLEDLLSSVSEGRSPVTGALQQASTLPECTYDVSLALRLNDAVQRTFRTSQEELRNAREMISLSQQNMDKRKQHIVQLAAQLKATEEKHRKDLKSNNEWMQHELKKEKGVLQLANQAERSKMAEELRESKEALQKRSQQQLAEAERGLDAYRQQLQDRFEQKLEHVQRSVDEIQAAAGQKNTVVADLEAKKNAMEKELAATKAKIPGLESEIRKLEESNFDFKDRLARLKSEKDALENDNFALKEKVVAMTYEIDRRQEMSESSRVGKQELDEVLAQNATLQEKLGSLELLVSENQEEIRRLRETKHVPEVQQQQRSEQAPKEEARASAAAAPFPESRARALYPRKAESQDEMSFEVNDEVTFVGPGVDPGWMLARKGHVAGFVPANYFQLLAGRVDHSPIQEATKKSSTVPTAPSAELLQDALPSNVKINSFRASPPPPAMDAVTEDAPIAELLAVEPGVPDAAGLHSMAPSARNDLIPQPNTPAQQKDLSAPSDEVVQEKPFVGGAEMWMRFVTEGLPVEGSPDLFEIQGLKCNQPFYDENKVCEVRVIDSGKLLYRGLGIHGPDHRT